MIRVGTIISYTDLSRIAKNTANKVKHESEDALNLWKDQTSKAVNDIQQKISTMTNACDYIEHVENYPLNLLDNKKLNRLIELAGNQKINLLMESRLFEEDNKWQDGFQDLSKRYLEQFSKLQRGHLYRKLAALITLI